MTTQFDKNSVYLAAALYRSSRREKKLRLSLAVIFVFLVIIFTVMCAIMCYN